MKYTISTLFEGEVVDLLATDEVMAFLDVRDRLTDREWDVLYRVSLGESNSEICQSLCLADVTVKKHLSSIYAKTGTLGRSRAIVWYWRLKLLVATRSIGGQEKAQIQIDIPGLFDLLLSHRYRWTDEKDLQDGLEKVFMEEGLPYSREFRLGTNSVIDFLVGGRIGVEVKIKGSAAPVLAQLERYAAFEQISSLVLVTGRLQLANMPGMIGGKPLRVLPLIGSLL